MAPAKTINQLKQAYAYCQHIAKAHYENFPVASICLPRNLREPIAAIYAFARIADDYADNSRLNTTDKLRALNKIEEQLINLNTTPTADLVLSTSGSMLKKLPFILEPTDISGLNHHVQLALADTIHRHELPILPFLHLLAAFKQDIIKSTYADFDEILNYCSYSANPIGRLLLHLTKQDTIENLKYSDYICTGLQLINFMQDLFVDLTKLDCCYLPQNELNHYQVSIDELKAKAETNNIAALLKCQLDRIRIIYQQGFPLGSQLNGIFGFEIKLIITGGQQILTALFARQNYYERPILTVANKLQMFRQSLFYNAFFSKN